MTSADNSSRLMPAFEHVGRGEAIRATLQAAPRFEFEQPSEWGTAPIEAVHDPGLLRFLTTAWSEYQEVAGPTDDVMAGYSSRTAFEMLSSSAVR